MIRELVELAETLRKKAGVGIAHDALKKELVGIDCLITAEGEFLAFQCFEKIDTVAEALASKKGKARLLLDKCEEVLGVESKPSKEGPLRKHELFRTKLAQYRHLPSLAAVQLFYDKAEIGLGRAQAAFCDQVPEKKRIENVAFRIQGRGNRIHEEPAVYEAIIESYDNHVSQNTSENRCSVCASSKYPVGDIPHGMIKRVPSGQSSGCALVSYNSPPFESYGLTGNNNSAICTHCAKAYVESLNWLMSNGSEIPGEGKKKPQFVYSNRKKISADTTFAFWLKHDVKTEILDLLETPSEDKIRQLINAASSGVVQSATASEAFYGLTLSGVAARIAIRDWIQIALPELQRSIRTWFNHIAIAVKPQGATSSTLVYHPMYSLIRACKKETDSSDDVAGRIGARLWHSAITNARLPLWILSTVLQRLKAEQGKVTPERAALIKLFLIRNKYIKGDNYNMEKLEEDNQELSYRCGRLFAVLERLQYHAQGEVNAGIGERFFTAASTTPAAAFGRLLKLAKQHLSKLKGEKPGLSVSLDKEIQEIVSAVKTFPQTFKLEEQGLFALGYFHQRHSRNEPKTEIQ